jgi:hypothetical protein
MQIELLVNGGVSILLSPDNVMEEELIKQLMKQDNILTEIRSNIVVLNKTFRNGVLIGKSSSQKKDETELDDQENKEAL